jgi:hypothetical protein
MALIGQLRTPAALPRQNVGPEACVDTVTKKCTACLY